MGKNYVNGFSDVRNLVNDMKIEEYIEQKEIWDKIYEKGKKGEIGNPIRICVECGKEYENKFKSHLNGIFCSFECISNYKKKHKNRGYY